MNDEAEVRYLSPDEMGQILGVQPGWIRDNGRKHGMPLKKVGHYVRCREDDFQEWLAALPDAA